MRKTLRGFDWKTLVAFIALIATLVLVYGFINKTNDANDAEKRLAQRDKALAEVSATAERATRLLEQQQTVLTKRYQAATQQRDDLQRSLDLLTAFLQSQGIDTSSVQSPSRAPQSAGPDAPSPAPSGKPGPTKAPQPGTPPTSVPPTPTTTAPSVPAPPTPAPSGLLGLGVCVVGVCL